MRVTIFGSGYVGLVTSVCLAQMGNHVTCIDVDVARVKQLIRGESPIYEPGLSDMLRENLETKRIFFTTESKTGVETAEVIFIAVGTPPEEDGSADLRYVLEVAETIGSHLNGYKVVVNKSTVPVGTTDNVSQAILKATKKRGLNMLFDVVSNPEFLKEGVAISDCMRPDRIVIGSSSEKAVETLKRLYRPFNRNHDKLLVMDERSAEMTKYVANAMLATKISFMNEMSQIAECVGADIEKVRLGIGSDPRIGFSFIYPGCGYGGSCFPKDIQALRHIAETYDHPANILRAVHEVNESQKHILFEKVLAHYHGDVQHKIFAIWGLSFKPNTDDVRDASSRVVIEELWKAGAKIQAYDPEGMKNFDLIYKKDHVHQYILSNSPEAVLDGADGLIIFTEWMVFRSPDFLLLATKLKDRAIFDGRNLYEPELLKGLGLRYYSIGRN